MHSQRSNGINPLFIAFRNDVSVAIAAMPAHETENEVCARNVIGIQSFSFIAAYIDPCNTFDELEARKYYHLDDSAYPNLRLLKLAP